MELTILLLFHLVETVHSYFKTTRGAKDHDLEATCVAAVRSEACGGASGRSVGPSRCADCQSRGKCPSPSERPEVEPSDFASSPWRHDDDRRKRDRSGWCWMFIEASRQSKMEKSELYIMLQTVDKPITRRTVHALDRYACGGFTKYWPQPPSP